MDQPDAYFRAPTKLRINKWRVREGQAVSASQVILFYEEVGVSTSKTTQKLKASKHCIVTKRLFKDGEIVDTGVPLLVLTDCQHTTVIKDMCANCGADLRQNENGNNSEASVPMVHSIPDLKVSQKIAQKLGHDDTLRLLETRKLVLLVDLDQTVIHTTNDNVPNNIKGIYHFQLYGPHSPWYHTRLRPGTSEFLSHIAKYYELHICTFGARNYAHTIAQLLDPEGNFFSQRILSRDECFNATSKTDNLRALFPNGDSMVCIIDDREDVWNMASNLIQVKPYHFFQHTGDINAPPGLSKHELDGEGIDFKDIKDLAQKKDKSCASEKIDNNKTTNNSTSTAAESSTEQKNAQSSIQTEVVTPVETLKDVEIVVEKPLEVATDPQIAFVTELIENTADKVHNDSAVEVVSDIKKSADEKEEDSEAVPVAMQKPYIVLDVSRKADIPAKIKLANDQQSLIEIEDPDDYLLYLEVILKTIHTRFYSIYDETKEIPDLKIIVPKIRSEVLLGQNLVFSGLVQTNMRLENSRAYFIAKSLGANVSENFEPDTTHLVAVASGTFKVNAARKNPEIKIVNANWLWSCAERWERVEEKLFPLDRKMKGKQRQPPAHCHSPQHVVNYSDKSEISSSSSAQQQHAYESEKFINTINPLLSFSNADLKEMNEEFESFFNSDSSSVDEHINIENPPVDKILLKRKRKEENEERTRDFFSRPTKVIMSKPEEDIVDKHSSHDEKDVAKKLEEGDDNDDDDESPSAKFRRGESLASDLDIGSESNDSDNNQDTEDDGDWNMMGAALEREFLGLKD